MSEIIMPKMGDAMTEGKVVQWYKAEGDMVSRGEPVLEIETDKVNLDLEAEEDGVLETIDVGKGSTVEVGTILGIVGDGSAVGKKRIPSKKSSTVDEPQELPDDSGTKKEETKEAPDSGGDDRGGFIRSSPLARKMAGELGVDLTRVAGSGPRGRIIAEDVRRAASTGAVATSPAIARTGTPEALVTRDVPLSAMRRTIARRLIESIGPVPHFFLTVDLDVTELLSLRAQLNEIQSVKTSVNDFVIRASALALLYHPIVNASFGESALKFHGEVHIGVAVSTAEGLLTPVVRNADRKNLPQIAAEVRDLAERARNRKLKPDEYQGSTFTISNLGMYGIEEFTAIINPPNSAILAVGGAEARPVVEQGAIVARSRMKVTMSCDHRVIDGAAGAEFLKTLRQNIEQPIRLIV